MEKICIESVKKGEKIQGYITIGEIMNFKFHIPTIVIRSHNDSYPILNVHAGIHGNEYEGIAAVIRLARELSSEDLIRGTLIFNPVVNTTAFLWTTRENPIDLKDLARCFPGDPDGTISQRIAYVFYNEVIKKSDYVIGLHSAGRPLKILPFTEFFDAPGKAGKESLAMAKAFGVKYLRKISLPPVNVTCTAKAAEDGIPAIEPEICGEERCSPENVDIYVNGVKNVMKYLGMIDGKVEFKSSYVYFDGKWVPSEKGGFFIPKIMLGEDVEEGSEIGFLYDWFGNEEPVKARFSGKIIGIRTLPLIRQGEIIAHIGRPYRVE